MKCPKAATAIVLATIAAPCVPGVASAATYYYVEWSAADVQGGTASGTITLPDAGVVNVSFAAMTDEGGPGNLSGAQVNGQGTNYWIPSAPYISTEVENPPPDSDIVQLAGGQDETYIVTLSEPIRDPIMAIVSLGQAGTPTTYDFDSPFAIVSQGMGFFGGNSTSLSVQPNNVLLGREGHGTIQFIGTYSTFSWTVPTPEYWHGFTFGIRTTEALEPTPDGGDDASDATPDDASDATPDVDYVEEAGPDGSAADVGAPPMDAAPADVTAAGDATPLDATGADATVGADASAAVDASVTSDSSAGPDAGTVDATALAEADTPGPDAAYEAGVAAPPGSSDGCNCSTVSAARPPSGAVAFLLLGVALGVRRRRRS
jgi:MYXO-CTERM domain-containing protein